MIVIVTGGRDYSGTGLVEALNALAAGGMHLIVGDARGADTIAREWWSKKVGSGFRSTMFMDVFVADWVMHGKAAGPKRNEDMVRFAREAGRPVICLAAPGGRGTADCVRRCREAGFEVREVTT